MSENLKFLESIEILTDFFNFYNDLAPQVFNFDSENDEFLNQVKSVTFLSLDENAETIIMKPDIDFEDEAIRCAYILKYSVINTYCTFQHFQNVYTCDSSLFNQLKEMAAVRICCFGGGAGTELVALWKVISDFLKRNSNEDNQYAIKLYFTVIDVCSEWESWIFSLVKELKKCDKEVVDVRLRYIRANLTKKWGGDVLKAVQKADILTMVKFLSALNLNEVDYEKKRDLRLLANVAREMKLNSWIFFLDFSGGGFYKKMRDKMKKYQYFQQCQSFLHQNHSLNKDKIKNSRSFLSFMYVVMSRNTDTKVSSGVWKKCIPELKIKQKKPNSVKKISTAQKLPLASSILEEQMEGLLLKEVLKVKEEELDDYYEVPADQEDHGRVQEIEAKNKNKVKEILKKSGIYKVKTNKMEKSQRSKKGKK